VNQWQRNSGRRCDFYVSPKSTLSQASYKKKWILTEAIDERANMQNHMIDWLICI